MDSKTKCVSAVDVSTEGYSSLTVPVHRATTIRYRDGQEFADRFERGADDYVYGLYGTPTHRYLERKLTELEGGARTVLAPSGQAAISAALLFLLNSGDRLLLPDTTYGPVRDLADNELTALGINVGYYDPCDLDALAQDLDAASAALVWVESPGSLTMEIQDIPAIVRLARGHGALVGCDNSWASPLNFRPLEHGVDLVVEALSKHIGGHSDVLMGSITVADADMGLKLKASMGRLGINAAADDCVLVMRGIETLGVRMDAAEASALKIARWLHDRPEVSKVLHPALPDMPGHDIWRRDFDGASGVFSFVLTEAVQPHVLSALDALELISIGASFGGTKSLLAPSSVKGLRSVTPISGLGTVMRMSVGMEATADLIADLTRFFDAIAKVTPKEGRARSEKEVNTPT